MSIDNFYVINLDIKINLCYHSFMKEPLFKQNFLNQLYTTNNKHLICEGLFKGLVVSVNDDCDVVTFTQENCSGEPLFSISTKRRNLDEQALIKIFISHISQECAKVIVDASATKTLDENFNVSSYIQEKLPACLSEMSKALFFATVSPREEDSSLNSPIFVDIQVHVKDLLASCIALETVNEMKKQKENMKFGSNQKFETYKENAKNTYAEFCMLISEEVFQDNFETSLNRTAKNEKIFNDEN